MVVIAVPETVTLPPPSARTPNASRPVVLTDPPLIVVVPPAPLSAPFAPAPLVVIVELVSDMKPPEVRPPGR